MCGARAEGITLKLKKITGLLACAAMALSLAACKFTTPAVVMTVEGEQIPAGLYLMYQYQAYGTARSKQVDTSADVLKSEIEGVNGAEWIHTKTLDSVKRYIWVERAFADAGMSFTEEEQASIDSQIESIWSYNEELMAANGVGLENYRRYYECESKYEKLLAQYTEEQSDLITDDEAKQYMDEMYSQIKTVTLPVTDEESNSLSEDQMSQMNELAEQLAADLNDGGDFDELAAQTLEQAFEIAGRTYSEDSAAQYISSGYVKANTITYPEEVVDAAMAAQVGDAMVYIYDDYSGIPMVYQKVANYTDDDDFAQNYRSTIVSEIASADYAQKVEQETADYSVEEDASAVKTYSPSKVKESV